MKFEYREYQAIASEKLALDVETCHPLVAIPTGAGKTIIIARFIYLYRQKHPDSKILILSHTENILKQNYKTLSFIFKNIGLYSSGLKTRKIRNITIAGIQSIFRKPELFKDFDIVIIDECHTIQRKNSSMYQKLFNGINPNHKRVGFSATIFRRKSGYLHEGEGAMFDKVSYDLSSSDAFVKLIEDGYLCKLIMKSTEYAMDTDGVKVTAGDYNQKDLADRFDRDEITNRAIEEIIKYGANYKSWLIFAINIEHAEHITNQLLSKGVIAASLHSKSELPRDLVVTQFKKQKITALVSVGMVTTGFDAPNVDLIGMLRPTKSPVLHVQTAGRGTRPFPGKEHCLFLDFAGNVSRLGPINHIEVRSRKAKGKGNGEPPVKTCPNCQVMHHPLVKVCDVCGHVFKFKQKIKTTADAGQIVKMDFNIEKWLKVDDVSYRIHKKYGKPDSLRVTYQCGLNQVNEYVCLDHQGYAQYKAQHWVNMRWPYANNKPTNVLELYNNQQHLKTPVKVLVNLSSKYLNINDVIFI